MSQNTEYVSKLNVDNFCNFVTYVYSSSTVINIFYWYSPDRQICPSFPGIHPQCYAVLTVSEPRYGCKPVHHSKINRNMRTCVAYETELLSWGRSQIKRIWFVIKFLLVKLISHHGWIVLNIVPVNHQNKIISIQ